MNIVLPHLMRGPLPSTELRRRAGLTSSSFKREIRALGDRVLRTGQGRATAYALRRTVDGVVTPVALHEGLPSGGHRQVAMLHPVEPWGYYIESHDPDVEAGFTTEEIPWFLVDITPVGFLGRAWLRRHPEAGFPSRLSQWTGDDTLRFATHFGGDLPGAFALGPVALDWLREPRHDRRVASKTRHVDYASLAGAAASVNLGSSPGGEQPKFTAVRMDGEVPVPVLVKFSAPACDATTQRAADLLRAEHLALRTLAAAGIEATTSKVLEHDGRVFLELERFDRTPAGGRVGMCSLFGLDRDGTASDLRRWSIVTAELAPEIDAAARWLEAFGHGIANTDMHLGNLSLRLSGTRIVGLTPVYDMLPMYYMPRPGVALERPVYPPSAHHVVQGAPRDAALAFWDQASRGPEFSDDFRGIASRQLTALRAQRTSR